MADKTWIEIRCAWCGIRFYARRRSRRFCSDACAKADSRAGPYPRYSRDGKAVQLEPTPYQSPTGRQRRPQTYKPVLFDGRLRFEALPPPKPPKESPPANSHQRGRGGKGR